MARNKARWRYKCREGQHSSSYCFLPREGRLSRADTLKREWDRVSRPPGLSESARRFIDEPESRTSADLTTVRFVLEVIQWVDLCDDCYDTAQHLCCAAYMMCRPLADRGAMYLTCCNRLGYDPETGPPVLVEPD